MTIAAFASSIAEIQLIKQTDCEDREGHGLVLQRHIRLSLHPQRATQRTQSSWTLKTFLKLNYISVFFNTKTFW